MALPFLFEPSVIDGRRVIDGGVHDNFPIKLFADDIEHTVGMCVQWVNAFKIRSMDQYFSRIVYMIMSNAEKTMFDTMTPEERERVICIDAGDISTVDFEINECVMRDMMRRGQEAVTQWT